MFGQVKSSHYERVYFVARPDGLRAQFSAARGCAAELRSHTALFVVCRGQTVRVRVFTHLVGALTDDGRWPRIGGVQRYVT